MRGLKLLAAKVDGQLRGRTRMGAWIETRCWAPELVPQPVAPVWVRGLKHWSALYHQRYKRRTRMGAWIETLVISSAVALAMSHPYGCVD